MSDERRAAVRARLDEEIQRLREHAATSVDPCDVAKLIAVSDERVVAELIERVARGDRFRGVRCVARGEVLFAFDCPPDMICLFPPSFLVVVDLRTRRVVEIIEHVDPAQQHPALQHPALQPSMPAARASTFRPTAARATARATLAFDELQLVTVTIDGVQFPAAEIDGHALAFDGPTAVAQVGSGAHELIWGARDNVGTPFTVTLTGATEPFSIKRKITSPLGEGGKRDFDVA